MNSACCRLLARTNPSHTVCCGAPADVTKHAVLGKFNEIRPGVYREFMKDVCEKARTPDWLIPTNARTADARALLPAAPVKVDEVGQGSTTYKA